MLGLPVFRFYDLDNANSVTYTGQSLIKFTKKIYQLLLQGINDKKDYCIYIDTDSVFIVLTIVQKRFPNKIFTEEEMIKIIMEICGEVQEYLNKSYNYFKKKFCNLHEHRFDIKQEVI